MKERERERPDDERNIKHAPRGFCDRKAMSKKTVEDNMGQTGSGRDDTGGWMDEPSQETKSAEEHSGDM